MTYPFPSKNEAPAFGKDGRNPSLVLVLQGEKGMSERGQNTPKLHQNAATASFAISIRFNSQRGIIPT
jgi:hypothetical protein